MKDINLCKRHKLKPSLDLKNIPFENQALDFFASTESVNEQSFI